MLILYPINIVSLLYGKDDTRQNNYIKHNEKAIISNH